MSDRIRVVHPEGGRVLVKQAMGQDADINVIMRKWHVNGVLNFSGRQPRYGDFSSGADFHESMNRVLDAEASFMRLSPEVRRYCNGDPAEYLDLCLNPDRRAEREKLGLQEKELPEKALLVRMAEPEPGPGDEPVGEDS